MKRKSVQIIEPERIGNGKLILYKQSSTRSFMCKFFAEGKYKVRSLGTENYERAVKMAIDWHDETTIDRAPLDRDPSHHSDRGAGARAG